MVFKSETTATNSFSIRPSFSKTYFSLVRLPAFEIAKAKFIEYSRKKSKMSVTKWELLLILQLNTDEVKRIGQFITGEQEPMQIDLNTIFILMVLCNQEMDIPQKITNILSFIAFDCDPTSSSFGSSASYGTITIDEFEYIFRLIYMLVSRISNLDLIKQPQAKFQIPVPGTIPQKVKSLTFGSNLEADLACELFGIVPPSHRQFTASSNLAQSSKGSTSKPRTPLSPSQSRALNKGPMMGSAQDQ